MLPNQAHTYGDWTPLDTRDPETRVADEATVAGQTVTPDADPEHELEAQSNAIQKGVTIVTDFGPSGLSPGDILEYTLEFQISDYFAFQAVRIDDMISDGQRWHGTFMPTMTVTEHENTLATDAMNTANYTVTPNYSDPPATTHLGNPPKDGTTAIQFRISNELVTRGQNANLVGGGIHSQTDGLELDDNLQNNPPLPHGGTVGTIKFRTVVQDKYSDDFPSGNHSLNHRDGVDNTAVIYGELLAPADLAPLGTSETDDTAASLAIEDTQLAKSIYAINGSTTLPSPLSVRPGDLVTFRLEMPLITGDVEIYKLTDYVPLPIMKVNDPDADGSTVPTWTRDATAATAPAARPMEVRPHRHPASRRGPQPGLLGADRHPQHGQRQQHDLLGLRHLRRCQQHVAQGGPVVHPHRQQPAVCRRLAAHEPGPIPGARHRETPSSTPTPSPPSRSSSPSSPSTRASSAATRAAAAPSAA